MPMIEVKLDVAFLLRIASILQKSWYNETFLELLSASTPPQMIHYNCDIENPAHHLKIESQI